MPSDLAEDFVVIDGDVGKNSSKIVKVVQTDITLPTSDDSEEETVEDEDAEDEDILASFSDDAEDIDLTHARLSTTAQLRLSRFSKSIKRLCLRQNFLTSLDSNDMQSMKALEELDLYDNKFKDGSLDGVLDHLPLRILDLSFNLFRSIPDPVATLPLLQTVYFVQNKITKIAPLNYACTATLTSLELGGNRIRKIEHLDSLTNLEELWLGKNKIAKLQNLGHLSKLRILSIQSNRITKLEGLDALDNLEEFYISHNGLTKIEGLDNNHKLTVLDVSSNQISEIGNIRHLSKLTEFWASSNKIPSLQHLETELGGIETLKTIYLEGNPCQRNDMSGYRRKVILALPTLTQLDATYIKGL